MLIWTNANKQKIHVVVVSCVKTFDKKNQLVDGYRIRKNTAHPSCTFIVPAKDISVA